MGTSSYATRPILIIIRVYGVYMYNIICTCTLYVCTRYCKCIHKDTAFALRVRFDCPRALFRFRVEFSFRLFSRHFCRTRAIQHSRIGNKARAVFSTRANVYLGRLILLFRRIIVCSIIVVWKRGFVCVCLRANARFYLVFFCLKPFRGHRRSRKSPVAPRGFRISAADISS